MGLSLPNKIAGTKVISCRMAVKMDLDDLVEIENSSFDYYRLKRKHFRYLITRGRSDVIVAEESGKVYGYAIVLYRGKRKSARLYSIAVHPDFRKRDIGHMLLDASIGHAQARGIEFLDLEVKSELERLVSFYRGFGFELNRVSKDYYGTGKHAMKLRKDISLQKSQDHDSYQNLSLLNKS